MSPFHTEPTICVSSERDQIANYWCEVIASKTTFIAVYYEFQIQSIMQILTECMLKWDINFKSSTGKGIFGTVRAFAGADKEQGHKTLHRHWQIWLEDVNQSL